MQAIKQRAGIVYDGVFDKVASSAEKIEQALQAGKKVDVIYTHRDPVDAFRVGILGRGARMEDKAGSGRTMPASYAATVYARVGQAIRDVRDLYKGNPDVKFHAVDNSFGFGNSKLVELDDLPRQAATKEVLEQKFLKVLDEEYQAGRISKKIYDGMRR